MNLLLVINNAYITDIVAFSALRRCSSYGMSSLQSDN